MNTEEIKNLADRIEQYMFERGEYDYETDPIKWIGDDREQTTQNIQNALENKEKALVNYFEYSNAISDVNDELFSIAKSLQDEVESLIQEPVGEKIQEQLSMVDTQKQSKIQNLANDIVQYIQDRTDLDFMYTGADKWLGIDREQTVQNIQDALENKDESLLAFFENEKEETSSISNELCNRAYVLKAKAYFIIHQKENTMPLDEVIDNLRMDMDLTLFDPLTGESEDPSIFLSRHGEEIAFSQDLYRAEQATIQIIERMATIDNFRDTLGVQSGASVCDIVLKNIEKNVSVLRQEKNILKEMLNDNWSNDMNKDFYDAISTAIDTLDDILQYNREKPKYYSVSYMDGEIPCVNIAIAKSEEQVREAYSQYEVYIHRAEDWEIRQVEERGMPLVNCEEKIKNNKQENNKQAEKKTQQNYER